MKKSGYIIVLIFCSTWLWSQEPPKKLRIGFGAEGSLTNNGHGSVFEGHLTFSKGRNAIRVGPCVHKRTLEVTGGRLSWAYVLAGMDGEEQLGMGFPESNNGSCRFSLYAYMQYLNNTKLSYQRAKEETVLYSDTTIKRDWNEVRLSTLEATIGAQMDVKFLGYFQWRTFVGIGAYTYLNYIPGMYQGQTGLIFMLGTGLDIPSFKRGKKKQ